MTVTAVEKNPETLTMTLQAEFEASPERVWQLWADPRQLERWWGPPTYPATVTTHELTPGGWVAYHLTGPEGDLQRAYWEVVEADVPHSLILRSGFANDDGAPNTDLPVITMRVTIEDIDHGRTRMAIASIFESIEAMDQILAMGMEEGLSQAVGQIDAILANNTVPSGTGQ